MDYIIEVKISGEGQTRSASADPISLPLTVGGQTIDIKPGDRVAWLFSGGKPGEQLEVVFVAAGDLHAENGKLQTPVLQDLSDHRGPFTEITHGVDHAKGAIASDVLGDPLQAKRFCYEIRANGIALPWVPPAPDKKGSPFDIPRTPP